MLRPGNYKRFLCKVSMVDTVSPFLYLLVLIFEESVKTFFSLGFLTFSFLNSSEDPKISGKTSGIFHLVGM